jgi:integrase
MTGFYHQARGIGRTTLPLTDLKVKTAKPQAKPYKLTDGGGLYLLVKLNGSKYWQYRFRINGKQGTYQIGTYPDTSIKKAREEHLLAREKVSEGVNPKELKQARKVSIERNEHRFSYYYDEWIKKQNLAPSTLGDLQQRVEKNLTPYLDKKRIDEWTTLDLLKILQQVSDRGSRETAIRMASILRRVFNDVLLLQIIDTNPANGLNELLPKPDPKLKKNFAHIDNEADLSRLLKALDEVRPRQDYVVRMALKLMPLVFLRPGNIRFLRWSYISFKDKTIVIPASAMKRNFEHTVPLATQAVAILKAVQELTGGDEYVFNTSRGNGKPMSENTTTKAIQTLIDPETGDPYGKESMTSHGFRHTASTLLNEMGYDPDVIELQLAHINKDRIRATYNKAQLMEKRIAMMAGWANYLDELREQKHG